MKIRNCSPCPMAVLLFAGYASAQAPFTSGSTGSDGALSYQVPGTYNFDPSVGNLDPSGDNIFNFTTINIAAGVTLNLTSALLRNKPVIWLASGAVTIAGTLSLDGVTPPNLNTYGVDWIDYRIPAAGGPGGFPGGVGARPGSSALPGLGPGGSPVQVNPSCGAGGGGSFASAGSSLPLGPTYGNTQLVPLIGGSGGSGGCVASTITATDASGGTGGGGGGAIRIVSTVSITIATGGKISALGGYGGGGRSGGTYGGGGAGGAINLIAPTISGGGTIQAYANSTGGVGYITLNAANNTFTGNASIGDVVPTLRPLVAPPLPSPTTVPGVTINSVNGVNVPQPPQGAFQTPDVTINATTAVTINISAIAVPVGTVVQLNIQSELGPDQTISCNPLAGTLASSTATCSASFPTSVSRILASASW